MLDLIFCAEMIGIKIMCDFVPICIFFLFKSGHHLLYQNVLIGLSPIGNYF